VAIFPTPYKLTIMNLKEYKNENVITYHSTKTGLAIDETIDLFKQLKSYLYECSISKERLSPTKEVDLIWHSFILHTEEYAIFCNNFFNKFIHHRPNSISKLASFSLYADCTDVSEDSNALVADCDAGGQAEDL
jgi:hypothetical protein